MLALDVPALVTPDRFADLFGASPSAAESARMVAAEAAVRRFCRWHVAPVVEQTFTVDGSGGSVLVLPTLRLVDVLAVSNDGTAVDVDSLEWSHDGYMRGLWSRKLRGVQVTVRHGFAEAPDVVEIVCDAARRAQVIPAGVVRTQAGMVGVSYAEPDLLVSEKAHLALYRLP